jgi:hypothetical protein
VKIRNHLKGKLDFKKLDNLIPRLSLSLSLQKRLISSFSLAIASETTTSCPNEIPAFLSLPNVLISPEIVDAENTGGQSAGVTVANLFEIELLQKTKTKKERGKKKNVK